MKEKFVKAFTDTVIILLGTMTATFAVDKGIGIYKKIKEKRKELKNVDNEEYETGTF